MVRCPQNLGNSTPGSEEWRNALVLIDVARRLERLCGSREAAHVWLRGSHLGFGRAPMNVLEGARAQRPSKRISLASSDEITAR